MIVQPAFLISLFARIPITLLGKAAEAGFTVGRVLLTVDKAATLVDDQGAAAKVITKVVLPRRSHLVRVRITDTGYGDALLVIHHMEPVVLAGVLSSILPMVMLEQAINIDYRLNAAPLLTDQSLHALAAGIVEVLGM